MALQGVEFRMAGLAEGQPTVALPDLPLHPRYSSVTCRAACSSAIFLNQSRVRRYPRHDRQPPRSPSTRRIMGTTMATVDKENTFGSVPCYGVVVTHGTPIGI